MSKGNCKILNLRFSVFHRINLYIRRAIEHLDATERAPRHHNAFATHIPVLTAIGRMIPIRNILELGSGTISTAHFLNLAIFPTAQSVVSYENDYDWYELVRSQITDSRLDLRFVPGNMSVIVPSLNLIDFDLIFVDDSKSVNERSQTISQLALRKHDVQGLVAVHDFEQLAYREAAAPFAYQKRFRALNPEVGLIWSRHDLQPKAFDRAHQVIKSNVEHIEPDDVKKWVEVLGCV